MKIVNKFTGELILEIETLFGVDLYEADLRGADLRGADLRKADLREADLFGVDLYGAYLREADLRKANLCRADLREADLRKANLCRADLREANLYGADLRGADLCKADLRKADLRGVDLCKADLRKADLYGTVAMLQCPQFGAFIGFKKLSGGLIAKIQICEDAKRSSATTRKCRCSKALVLEIEKDGKSYKQGASSHDPDFIYEVGKIVEVGDFDKDRWNECSTGIHFFITKQEAIDY